METTTTDITTVRIILHRFASTPFGVFGIMHMDDKPIYTQEKICTPFGGCKDIIKPGTYDLKLQDVDDPYSPIVIRDAYEGKPGHIINWGGRPLQGSLIKVGYKLAGNESGWFVDSPAHTLTKLHRRLGGADQMKLEIDERLMNINNNL